MSDNVVASNLPGLLRLGSLFVIGAVIVAIAASLVARNVHYPSDVAAGLMIGAFWLVSADMSLKPPGTHR